jgi:Uma2 family endonuclease
LELIDGVLSPMNAKKNAHEIVKNDLIERLASVKRSDIRLAVETTLYLATDLFFEPDILMYPKSLTPEDVRGPDVLLLIEVADTSQARDLDVKAPIYALHGVRDYWVVDVAKRETTLHRDPTPNGYKWRETFAADAHLQALLMPQISLAVPWPA